MRWTLVLIQNRGLIKISKDPDNQYIRFDDYIYIHNSKNDTRKIHTNYSGKGFLIRTENSYYHAITKGNIIDRQFPFNYALRKDGPGIFIGLCSGLYKNDSDSKTQFFSSKILLEKTADGFMPDEERNIENFNMGLFTIDQLARIEQKAHKLSGYQILNRINLESNKNVNNGSAYF